METIRDPKATAPRRYTVRFFGRKVGALGTRSWVYAEIYADDPEAARVAIYQKYEHLSDVTITEPQA